MDTLSPSGAPVWDAVSDLSASLAASNDASLASATAAQIAASNSYKSVFLSYTNMFLGIGIGAGAVGMLMGYMSARKHG